jgi:hypothetical protein
MSGALLLLAALQAGEPTPARVRHALQVALDPATHVLRVSDEIALPPGAAPELLLNARLRITHSEPPLHEVPTGDLLPFFGINAGAETRLVTLKRYKTAAGARTLKLTYEGPVDFGLADQKEEYTRGFRETAGILNAQGVYLAGNGFWYPHLASGLLEFTLEVQQPPSWHVISQGNGVSRGADGKARWDSHGATDEIYLVGGPLTLYRDSAGSVEALAYLRQKDDALAAKYLAATAQYVEMYRTLIGPYPYGKFALVENFWETGYGMPSFTLLGPQIIRFPFILTSSYPHEILHNWWGNGVFVDYQSGNWCEGLTSYLADHLIQEQRGKGAEYRQATLQKYRDYVKDGRDFPLGEFRSRHSAATEAVGYGKTLMGFHMLRLKLGDDNYKKMLARFYREYRGKQASFRDVQKVAETVSGQNLARFFDDWITRPGAAALDVQVKSVAKDGAAYIVNGVLRQGQGGAPFALDVPVLVQTPNGVSRQQVSLDAAQSAFALRVPAEPLALQVDPDFDVFRRLDPRETPPSIGQIFGEPRILAVLPAAAPPERLKAYRELALGWKSDAHSVDVVLDADLEQLPADKAVWLYGRENRFARELFAANPVVSPQATEMTADGERMPVAGHSFVMTIRHPKNLEKAVGWISVEPGAAFPGMGRKLPHYGKYSYLGFEGDEPVNVLKGQAAASDSPLRVDLRPQAARTASLPALAPDARKALADLPPVFSQKALMDHVAFLASPRLDGRGLGSEGLREAARYVAERFKEAGLLPGGADGGYFQKFNAGNVETTNVIGVLPGSKPEFQGQSAILSAHYDHLGNGHLGADDNASGVAVMLELAKVMAAGEKPQRTLVFIAFSAEESGLLGSKYYVDHPSFPLDKLIGAVNLDTVGRLGDGRVSVFATGTASEWQHIFRGASFVTGVESRNIPEALQSSDHASFIAKGVPAVQLFTQAHADYHKPTDTADKVDAAGLVKVAALAKEAIVYLGERPQPLTNTIKPGPPSAPAAPAAGERRVSFGSIPDFAFAGPGVRVGGVVAGSPAEKAGLKEGDVITAIDGKAVANLQGFSDLLRTLAVDQTVAVSFTRDGKPQQASLTLAAR